MKFQTVAFGLASAGFLASAWLSLDSAGNYEHAANSRRETAAIYRDAGNIAMAHLQDSYVNLYDSEHDAQLKLMAFELVVAAGFAVVAIPRVRERRQAPDQTMTLVQSTDRI